MNYFFKSSFLFLLLVIGCNNPFNPEVYEKKINENSSLYCNPNTPDSVLKNLEYSYRYKDIDLFKDCLIDSFKFVLPNNEFSEIGIDMNGDGIKDDWWGYQQELEFHTNMFSDGSSNGIYAPPDQIELNIMVPDAANWETQEDGSVKINCYYNLYLTFYEDIDHYSDGQAQFYLKTINNDEWAIYKWVDLN